MASTVSIHLLGPLTIGTAQGPVVLRYQKARALLAYLLLERGFHTRDALAFLMWPGSSVQAPSGPNMMP